MYRSIITSSFFLSLHLYTESLNSTHKKMNIDINNKPYDTEAKTLNELAAQLELPAKGVAMAANNRMIPRNEWTTTPLEEGMKIVIIKAACGG